MRFRRRLLLLYVVFCCVMGVVWLRATQLQWIDGDVWAEAARTLRQRTERLDAMRGPIVSADGVVLAEDAPGFQLALVAWQWQRRERARCTACGAIYFRSGRRNPRHPRTCACARGARRGRDADAYPRGGGEAGPRLERLPEADLRPLEKALEVEPGTIARLARERVRKVEGIIAALRQQMEDEGDDTSFREKRLELRAQDLLMRPFVIFGQIPAAAARLILTDEHGRYRGLRVQSALRRHYPLGDFAPQLLGFCSELGENEYGSLHARFGDRVTFSTRIGRKGLEAAYNWDMHGAPGRRLMQLDDSGQFSEVLEDVPPRPGKPLILALDVKTSRIAEELLFRHTRPAGYVPQGRPSGAFVALDAYTGEIVLWAEGPRFDLNEDLDAIYDPKLVEARRDLEAGTWVPRHPLDGRMDLETWRALLVQPVPVGMSRVAQVAVEPGSTFKPLIALGLLESGVPLPFHTYTCTASERSPGCHHCGTVDLERAIARSCNRYFAYSVRDSKHWPTYRRFLGGFLGELGIGRKPSGEVAEWTAGQWLWPWVDFEMSAALDVARRHLQGEHGQAAPKLTLQMAPGAPETMGGDPERLGERLAEIGTWLHQKVGAERLVVSVERIENIERRMRLRFGVRAAGTRPWSVLPGSHAGALPRSLRGRARDRAGIHGHLERGGTVWFTAVLERRTGRKGLELPPVIRPEDGRNVAIGQGPVLVTPLHMARAMAVLANGGLRVHPHVVRSVGGREMRGRAERIRVDPGHLDRVREGMYRVVNAVEGTADRAGWGKVPAQVYGKTGTAQVGRSWHPFEDPEAEEDSAWHHWFVGFAEAEGRRTIAFACVLHARSEPAAGGTAAPAVADILARWYASEHSLEGR